jgi:hypothetical protein
MTTVLHLRRMLVVLMLLLAAGLAVWLRPGGSANVAAAAQSQSMSMSGTTSTTLAGQLARARLATLKYVTNLGRARNDGYQIITREMPGMGYHYLNPNIQGFDVTKPQILVYEHHGKTWQLGALEWVFPSVPAKPPLPDATFGYFPAACHYKDGTFVAAGAQSDCASESPTTHAAFSFWHPTLYTMHVWVWFPNPNGLYASTNPLVAAFNQG